MWVLSPACCPGLAWTPSRPVTVFGNRVVMETDVFGTIPEQMIAKLKPRKRSAGPTPLVMSTRS